MTLVSVVQGDIASISGDAVCNAANTELWMGSGVAGALREAGGPSVEHQARMLGPIGVGEAVATAAGALPVRYVIHGAVMEPGQRPDGEAVARTTRSCLELADQLGCRRLVMPAFGTGVGMFPVPECARLMVDEVKWFRARSLQSVVVAVFSKDDYRTFRRTASAWRRWRR